MNHQHSESTSTESIPSCFQHVSPETIHKVRKRVWWHFGEMNFCWPSNEHLAKACKLSLRAVKYALQAMKHYGEIKVEWYKRKRTIHQLIRPNLFVPARGPKVPVGCPPCAPHVPPNCFESPEFPESPNTQQQGLTPVQNQDVVVEVLVPEEIQEPEKSLVVKLQDHGVSTPVARKIVQKTPPEVIERQIEALPHRRVNNPVGALVASICEGWSMPVGFQSKDQIEIKAKVAEGAKSENEQWRVRNHWENLPNWLKDSYRNAALALGITPDNYVRDKLGFSRL